jgi:hypothetical protein
MIMKWCSTIENNKQKQKALCIVVENLLVSSNGEMTYSRNTSEKMLPKRYNKNRLGNTTIKNAVDTLAELGWVESIVGLWHQNPELRTLSRVIASSHLLELFPESEVYWLKEKNVSTSETIILKNVDKVVITYQDTPSIREMRHNCKLINTVNSLHTFTHKGNVLDVSNMVRIFNDSSFEKGGRFYRSGAQYIKQKDNKGTKLPIEETRLAIMIDGSPVVEVDYRSLHISLLAAMHNIDMDAEDFYVSLVRDGADRAFYKDCLNALLNISDYKTAVAVVRGKINKHGYDWMDAATEVQRIKGSMSLLSDYLIRPDPIGKHLQYQDSCIAERVMYEFAKLGKAIIPIHDSFIVVEDDEYFLIDCMTNAFREVTQNDNVTVYVKVTFCTGEERVYIS